MSVEGQLHRRWRLTRFQATSDDCVLNLVGQLFHTLDLFLRLLPLLDELVKLSIHRQSPRDKVIDLVFRDTEPGLHRLFTGPIFTMCLSFDEDHLLVHVAVPSKSDGFSTFRLFKPAEVKVKVFVVKVDGRDGGILWFEGLLGVED